MLLAIDIGNTNITFGVFQDQYLKARFRMATDRTRMPDEYGVMLHQMLNLKGILHSDIKAAAMCSVVPPLTPVFVTLCEDYVGVSPLIVGAGTKTGIRIMYDTPRDVGADRIVDAASALKLYGGPAIVVDIGTATVFDAVTTNGEYLGGAIAPGISIAGDSLFQSTSQLRRVQLETPPTAIGKNTVHAIQSGLVLGYTDLIKGMISRFDAELGGDSRVIATGGLANVIHEKEKIFDVIDPDLTLTGLRLIHEMNAR